MPVDVQQLTPAYLSGLKLWEIAHIIQRDWRPISVPARPYVEALQSLDSVDSMYLADKGKSIVLYFLSNAGSWRGEVARKVKAELRRRVS